MAEDNRIDGYDVNWDGEWTVDEVVQTKTLPSWLNYVNQDLYDHQENPDIGVNVTTTISYPIISVSDSGANQRINEETRFINEFIDGLYPIDEVINFGIFNYFMDYDFTHIDDRYVSLSVESSEGVGLSSYCYLTVTPEKGVLKLADLGNLDLIRALENSANRYVAKMVEKEGGHIYTTIVQLDGDARFMLTPEGMILSRERETYSTRPYEQSMVVPYSDIAPYLNDYGRQLIGLWEIR